MVFSFVYRAFVSLLKLLISGRRCVDVKNIELLVLRHQLEVLRRQGQRPTLRPSDRPLLAVMGRLLPPGRRHGLLVTLETVCAGIASRAAQVDYSHARPGRPSIDVTTRELVLRLARENSRWGGATSGSSASSGSSARRSRRAPFAGCSPRRALVRRQGARGRAGVSSCARRPSVVACDFFTVETALVRRYYRAVSHRAADAPRLHFWRDDESQRRMGDPAGAQPQRRRGGRGRQVPDP